MNRVLTIVLVVVAAILLLPKLGIGMMQAPAPAPPQPPPPSPSAGTKFRTTMGEIAAGVVSLAQAGKEIAGLIGSSRKPTDYGSISI